MNPWASLLSIRGRLIAIIGLILCVGFLATNLVSYHVSKDNLRKVVVEQELPLTSNNIYSEIQKDLVRPVFIASLMANDTFVLDWLRAGEKDKDSITRYLDRIRLEYGMFTSFLVSEATRNYYHFTGVSQVVSPDDPRDAWYFRSRGLRQLYELNVDLNAEQDNTLTIFINHQIRGPDGAVLAVTGVGLNFDTMATIVERYRELFDHHVYFLDHTGRILVRSAHATLTEDDINTAPGVSAVAKKILATEQGFFEYERNGETMLANTRHLPQLDWYVMVERSESQALAHVLRGLWTTTAIGVVSVALTLLTVGFAVHHSQARLETAASTDRLTGIGNRTVFDLALRLAGKRHTRDHDPFSLILMDLDHFKRVNDSFGHVEGDRILRNIATILNENTRASDVLCRWGGEEMIMLVHNCPRDAAAALAEKIRIAVATDPRVVLPDGRKVTFSAGVTQFVEGDTQDTVIRRCDHALYQAKSRGRDRVDVA